MKLRPSLILPVAAFAVLTGCSSRGEIVVDEGVGITAVRGACPSVGIPDYTGDITLFRTPGSTSAADIDVVASMTNVRTQCSDVGDQVVSTSTFNVLGRRSDTRGARQVTLPYYVVVMRGGRTVVTKRVSNVVLNFADGEARAQATGQGVAYINRAEATLPADIRERITRKRQAGDPDAAVDPLSEPEVKAAVTRANFEVLLGFNLDERQLAYNVTR